MVMTIAVTDVSATTATFAYGGLAADGTVDLQISSRSDFAFCVCPVLSIPRLAVLTTNALNQRATLFARARARRASGAVEEWSNVVSFRTSDITAQDTSPAAVMIEPAMLVVPEVPSEFGARSELPGFPAANLWRDAPVAWKSYQADGVHYFWARFSGAPVDTLALLNTNLPEATIVYLSAAPTYEGLASGVGRVILIDGAPFRASPDLPGRRGYHGLFTFPPALGPYFLVQLIGDKAAQTLHVEHAIFGRNRATKNHSIDKTETPLPKSTIERTRSGIPDRVTGLPMRKVEFDISVMTEAQYETTYGDLVYLENEAVLVVPNTKSGAFLHDRILFGDMKGSRIFNPSSPRFTRTFSIESII